MSDRQRNVAFALATIAIVGVVVALSLWGPGEAPSRTATRSSQRPPAAAPPTVLVTPPTPTAAPATAPSKPRAKPKPTPPRAVHRSRAAEACARDFVHAFLRYQAADTGPDVRRAIRRLATAPLASAIFLQKPLRGADRHVPRPDAIRIRTRSRYGRRTEITARIPGGGRSSLMLLALRKGPSGWRVADLP